MENNELNEAELYGIAQFGKQVEQFTSSDIGQYLLSRAMREYDDAVEEFRTVDVSNVEMVRSLQNKMVQSSKFMEWLQEAVREGLNALKIIENGSE